MSVAEKTTHFLNLCRTYGPRETFRRYLNYLIRLVWTYKPLWTPRRLYVALDSIGIDHPIFVVGTQGAGLTLLTRMIRRHPRVVMVGGGSSFWAGFDEMDKHRIGHAVFPDALSLRAPGYRNMTGREQEHKVFGLERSWVYATDELFPIYRKTEEDATDDICHALRQKIQSSIRAYAMDVRQARFLDMSQSYALKIPLLKRCLPNAQFVVQLRDPYVLCWREVTRRPAHKYRLWNKKPSLEEGLHFAVQHWENTYQTALSDLDGHAHGMVVRFENLISNPEQTLRRVLAFVDLQFTPDLLPQPHHRVPPGSKATEKWYPIRADVNETYRREVPISACHIIREGVGEIAEVFGYFPPKD